jgi:spore coat protein U domain-containing protein, fimbrial subunit CupE1/2/3/6
MSKPSITRIVLGLGLLGAVAAVPAQGASTTANLTVQVQVNANCTISTTPVDFGTYDPVVANASAAKTGSGTVAVACTKSSAPTIGLGVGSNASGSTRRMTNGTDLLTYELYFPTTNAASAACGALTTVWGTSGANLFTPTSPPNRNSRTYNVCGSIAGAQDVSVGAYADTVVATVTF